jgi:DNA-binding Xre family transcriptional regulator
MLRVRLREALEAAERRLGQRITYDDLAQLTGLARATLEAIGSRPQYNPRLSTIERLCQALDCAPADLLEFNPDAVDAESTKPSG